MTVYCYELKADRPRYFTQRMDRWLRAEYFPGLSVSMMVEPFRTRFGAGYRNWARDPAMIERILVNRLSDLGLRRRM